MSYVFRQSGDDDEVWIKGYLIHQDRVFGGNWFNAQC